MNSIWVELERPGEVAHEEDGALEHADEQHLPTR